MPANPNEGLEPLDPREAKDLYRRDRRDEVSEATLRSHGYRIERFMEWCEKESVDNLNDLTGRDIQRYKLDRSEDVNQVTLKSQLDTLRVFLRFCEGINGVIDGLPECVQSPSLDYSENRSDDIVDSDKADEILDYLSKFEYATRRHALFRFLWETGCRMGAARGVDLDDLHLSAEYAELHHWPEQDTPLKNKERGERTVALSTTTSNILRDYINNRRIEATDEYGREPLFTTNYGRITKNTIRTHIYRVTRPCEFGECPHDRDIDDCEARQGRQSASKCPDSTAPHSVRRGAITHFLKSDTPAKVVSDRMNVGQDTIEEHYDSRTERERMEQRRDFLDNI